MGWDGGKAWILTDHSSGPLHFSFSFVLEGLFWQSENAKSFSELGHIKCSCLLSMYMGGGFHSDLLFLHLPRICLPYALLKCVL